MFSFGPLEIVLLLILLILVLGWRRSGQLFGRALRHRDQIQQLRGQLTPGGIKQRLLAWLKDSLFGPR